MKFPLKFLTTIRSRWVIYAALFTVVLLTGIWIQQYIQYQMVERYLVYKDGQQIGAVSNPDIINNWIDQKQKDLNIQNPNLNVILDSTGLTYTYEKSFQAEVNNQAVVNILENQLTPQTKGTEIRVDDKPIGIVKDTTTAQGILDQLKGKYSSDGKVRTLALDASQKDLGKPAIESIDFLQKVSLVEIKTTSEKITPVESMVKKLESGDVQPVKYTVQDGDCVSCIAKKFNISTNVIYQNNTWIQNDFIKTGDVLDLTVLQPIVSVKSLEKRIDTLEIPQGIIYEKDDTMKAGTSKTVVEGKNGLKKVTYQITKINGQLVEEAPIDETIVEAAINKVVKQGTKVIPGIGTGSFAWPIYNARLTSEFGKRWGKLHAGTDTVSSNRTIMSADNGKVVFAGEKSGYGNCIIIDHQNGYKTLYAHLSKIEVSTGEIIQKGDKIGIMGSTGNSTGVHLHFEIHKNDQQENPLKYLNK